MSEVAEGRIVNWTGNGLKVVPLMKGRVGQIHLIPGVNFISPENWPHVEGVLEPDLKLGRVKMVMVEKGGKSVPATSLKDLDVPAAVEVIQKTDNPETLKAFKAQESREEVRVDLRNREEEIEAELKAAGKSGKDK